MLLKISVKGVSIKYCITLFLCKVSLPQEIVHNKKEHNHLSSLHSRASIWWQIISGDVQAVSPGRLPVSC